jgi:hypothetical protein
MSTPHRHPLIVRIRFTQNEQYKCVINSNTNEDQDRHVSEKTNVNDQQVPKEKKRKKELNK